MGQDRIKKDGIWHVRDGNCDDILVVNKAGLASSEVESASLIYWRVVQDLSHLCFVLSVQ